MKLNKLKAVEISGDMFSAYYSRRILYLQPVSLKFDIKLFCRANPDMLIFEYWKRGREEVSRVYPAEHHRYIESPGKNYVLIQWFHMEHM